MSKHGRHSCVCLSALMPYNTASLPGWTAHSDGRVNGSQETSRSEDLLSLLQNNGLVGNRKQDMKLLEQPEEKLKQKTGNAQEREQLCFREIYIRGT